MGKNLDNELAEAAGLDGSGADDEASMAVRKRPSRRRHGGAKKQGKKTSAGLLVMLLLMVGGIVSLFAFGFSGRRPSTRCPSPTSWLRKTSTLDVACASRANSSPAR